MRIRILVVDDHRLVREGLRLILTSDPQLEVVGEADGGRSALEMAKSLVPDIVIMDISMKDLNGIEAARLIRAQCSGTRVIAVSMHADDRNVLRMLEAGASGYLLKSADGEELIRAVHSVADGNEYLSPALSGMIIHRYLSCGGPSDAVDCTILNPREREVIQLLAEGYTSKEIAARLEVAPATVETHRRNVMKKLNIHSIAGLTRYAVREGLTTIEP